MSNNSQLNKLGEQMKGALNDALTTGDYRNLKTLVSDTVTSALNEAGATASKAWQQKEEWKRQQEEMQGKNMSEEWKRQEALREQEIRRKQAKAAQEAAQREAAIRQKNELMEQRRFEKTGLLVNVKNEGLVAGVLFIVFGSIANVTLFILALIGIANGWGTVLYLLAFLLVSIFFICHGKAKVQLIDKAKRYVKLCGSKMYAEVEELAAQVGISSKKVTRELRKILRKGIIPSAHLDKKGTHLMLNDVIYKQYTDAEKARVLREKEEKEKAKIEAKEPKKLVTEEKVQEKTELEQMMEEGQEFIQKLRDMNDVIPGEGISAKLYQLENLLKEIFQRIQKVPGQMNRMHKVMNYYLPTTLKLVEAYHEFDIISTPNDEILSAKKEIEETLDTINEAFVELLNSLFQDKVMDITTDAQVLQTMLANEGLTKDMDITKAGN